MPESEKYSQEQAPGLNREVLTVSDLNRNVRRLLEGEFPTVWVEGEISNFARPSSGHWYFTLKDSKAQLRCAMFRNRNQLLRFTPENGAQVTIRGRISLYEGRGEFQLIAEHLEETGDGALRRAIEELRLKLQKEGLFDEARKRKLPTVPRHVGIITSPTGAAIQDILNILERRFPAIEISILPVQVQGADSVSGIANQIEFANRYEDNPFDLLLLTRGGGSLEDMMSFNAEIVILAIAGSKIPMVCAVGHESDVTIADFAADLRAPTPSAAAELISPDMREWLESTVKSQQQLLSQFTSLLSRRRNHLDHLSHRLGQPSRRLQDFNQQLDHMELRLQHGFQRQWGKYAVDDIAQRLYSLMQQCLEKSRVQLQLSTARLANPLPRIQQTLQRTSFLLGQFNRAVENSLNTDKSKLHMLGQKLNALSPLATLERGYAIVRDQSNRVVTHSDTVAEGESLKVRLQQGQLTVEVKDKQD